MIVRLIKRTKIYNFTLPNKVEGNYWITDNDSLGNVRNLINVEESEGRWKIKSDFETKIMSGDKEIDYAYLSEYSIYFLKISTENEYVILYCSPTIDPQISRLKLKQSGEILIGNGPSNQINYGYPLVTKTQARLTYNNNRWHITDMNSQYGTYVNNIAVLEKDLEYGDIIFILGLKIILLNGSIIVNNISNLITFDSNTFTIEQPSIQTQVEKDNPDEEGKEFFKEDDYFFRSPRFKTKIEPVNIIIDDPPAKQITEKQPLIMTIGPMLTMSMMSVSMGYSSISGLMDGSRTVKESLPGLIMCGSMLLSTLLWPLIAKAYQNRQQKKLEKLRQEKYSAYIEEKRQKINYEMKIQRQILIDNYLPLNETKNIVLNKKRNLWEREIDQEDFLDLRLGIGSTELQGNVKFPEKKFSLYTDNLLEEVYKLGAESRTLVDVPISLSFINKRIVGIIGTGMNKQKFIDGLILQMMTFHSYDDLKIVLLTNEMNESNWSYLRILPHCFSNDKSIRYYATNLDEAKEISLNLEKVLYERVSPNSINTNDKPGTGDYKEHKPYYMIITDDYKMVRDVEIVKDVVSLEKNVGFSMIAISPRLINLPNECKTFISIGDKKSGVFENELVSNKQKEFIPEIDPNLNIYECCKKLANIPIDIAKAEQNLPTSLSFLEMYNVGMIEQLNILNRWKNNDPTKSLSAPVGVDKSSDLFKLDLHEKFHGPHGLIAGMTGSGKSEFIITYILSMAINYHPYEVSFVLIDYKGGGLTGAFENKETGMVLPHLAGTITNLDTVEMNRSLASIQSELRRRQKMFNIARDSLNESTIDIYKYQSLYRKGLVKEPISHLFIISDEFAELKSQRPEFMDQLISTARIGRSLGVHLILATQKPAGVVNDQIWSNSKFRVCLKVQDNNDSQDMIKRPDAAELKNPGRFFLQVGYNELFALGQAAWAGAQYYPTQKIKKKVDTSVTFIDDVATPVKSLDSKENKVILKSEGEELTNIVKYIVNEAKENSVSIPKLWLDRIPNIIYVDKIKEKYGYKNQRNIINPLIGEYDDPDNQRQAPLTLPLSTEGNTAIYGSTGSGKELMISSIIYSTIISHRSDEVNFYVIDFGAETLKVFDEAPQVGDVLLSTDKDKITNLFKMLNSMIEERKKLFLDYNGSYDFYINHGGKQLPFIVVVVNNTEAFLDTYPEFEDTVTVLTRDCLKYGIAFIFTASTPNGIRYRMKQNFKQNLVLQFNDPNDYMSVINGARRKEPSKAFGRGLVDLDGVFEFQTAYPYKEEKMSEFIKVICERLKSLMKERARKIPVLPEIVDYEYLKNENITIDKLPLGIEKNSLNISSYDFIRNKTNLITGEDISEYEKTIRGITDIISKTNNPTVILDSYNILESIKNDKIIYDNNTCANGVKKIIQIYEDLKTKKASKVICIITGFSNIMNKLSPEDKTKIIKILNDMTSDMYFVLFDTINNIKNFSYDDWFKNTVSINNAIWLGNGLANQFTLKISNPNREISQEVPINFGYVINKSKAELVKFITKE